MDDDLHDGDTDGKDGPVHLPDIVQKNSAAKNSSRHKESDVESDRASTIPVQAENHKKNRSDEESETEDGIKLPQLDVQHGSIFPETWEKPRKYSRKSKGKGHKENKDSEASLEYDEYPILRAIQNNVIGHDLVIKTPYGSRQVVYCDFTASGRSLGFIEDYIREHVCPNYANTHSTTGHNARQTGKFREEARKIIRQCVNANKDDVVIFTGSGATSAFHKIAWALKINQPITAGETVVLNGPYEHHSSILLWREYGTEVRRIRQVPETGLIDLHHLENELMFWRERRRHLLVCVSAASNVSGIITDVDAVSAIAHNYGAIVIFDYASIGPYTKIDMNPSKTKYKDVVITSPHKFVGGPGTPGILIAKKWLFRNPVPERVGGGTVRFVTRETHGYVGNIEEREEGGTPAIIESIRAGLVFRLKQEIGTNVIMQRDEDLCRRAFEVWEKNPCIHILGNHRASRIPIFSFLTKHLATGRLVHHNYISTLLSDLFGVQARGGCACAGPYAEDLLGMPESLARKYMRFLKDKQPGKDNSSPFVTMDILKPGFTRINLPFFNDDETIDFIIQAVDMVTRHGWKLLPEYTFDIQTGSWQHIDFSNSEQSRLHSLEEAFRFDMDADQLPVIPKSKDDERTSFKDVLEHAEKLFKDAEETRTWSRISSASRRLRDHLPRDKRRLRWFLTPGEAASILANKDRENYLNEDRKLYRLPFKLEVYKKRTTCNNEYDSNGGVTHRSDRSGQSDEVIDTHKMNNKPSPAKMVPRLPLSLLVDGNEGELEVGVAPDSHRLDEKKRSLKYRRSVNNGSVSDRTGYYRRYKDTFKYRDGYL